LATGFDDFAAFFAADLEARRAPGTLPIRGSLATISSQARSAASSGLSNVLMWSPSSESNLPERLQSTASVRFCYWDARKKFLVFRSVRIPSQARAPMLWENHQFQHFGILQAGPERRITLGALIFDHVG
jgi:hypothetical protein